MIPAACWEDSCGAVQALPLPVCNCLDCFHEQSGRMDCRTSSSSMTCIFLTVFLPAAAHGGCPWCGILGHLPLSFSMRFRVCLATLSHVHMHLVRIQSDAPFLGRGGTVPQASILPILVCESSCLHGTVSPGLDGRSVSDGMTHPFPMRASGDQACFLAHGSASTEG